MNIKDSAGTIVIVLTIVGMFFALSGQIGDIRERITRVETVMTGYSAEVLRLHKRMDDHERPVEGPDL